MSVLQRLACAITHARRRIYACALVSKEVVQNRAITNRMLFSKVVLMLSHSGMPIPTRVSTTELQ